MGAEALLRWENEKLGFLPPDEFIPIAEQTGIIVEIGQYVMQEAFKQAAKWNNQVADFQIAVNLSPVQFRDPALMDFVTGSLQQSGLDPTQVELEITEGVLLSGSAQVDKTLEQINDLGAKISMDDFGTGYSSLSYLRQYPFDVLKIDRSFINDISETTSENKLIDAAIAMAHGLGLEVVAEGIETAHQSEYLRDRGCDYAQGYLFSKPIRTDEMEALMSEEQNLPDLSQFGLASKHRDRITQRIKIGFHPERVHPAHTACHLQPRRHQYRWSACCNSSGRSCYADSQAASTRQSAPPGSR